MSTDPVLKERSVAFGRLQVLTSDCAQIDLIQTGVQSSVRHT